MKNNLFLLTVLLGFIAAPLFAQDTDIDNLLDEEEPETEYVLASFKTTRVINALSLENTHAGVLDFKISHRFGFLSGGPYELFGLDQAYMRIGFDYGITPWLMVGVGRSNYEKTFDGLLKAKILRQSKGKRNMPISLQYATTIALKSQKFADPDRDNYFSSRLAYTHQLIIGRKFSDAVSFQIMPTLVHRNLTQSPDDKNDVLAIGAAGRVKLTKRIAINGEYYYVLPNQVLGMGTDYHNSLSLGFDIETGGHVFQLHFTNSTSMVDKGVITETVGDWLNGDIHFGFNVSRVFTIYNPKK